MRLTLVTLLLALPVTLTAVHAQDAPPPPPEPPVGWDLESFARVVQPFQHSLAGRLPLLLWNFPLPRGDALVTLRETGELRRAIELMAERGIVPTVEMGWHWTPEGALAMAHTLQEAGQPVHVLWPWLPGGEEGLYANCPVWGEGPDATRGGEVRKWPCLPLYDVSTCVAIVREWMQRYRDEGLELAAFWLDYEALPHPWNGCYEAMRKSEACREHFPPGVLDTMRSFQSYCYNLRARILSEAVVDPVHEFYPRALVGNYGEVASSEAVPLYGTWPPFGSGRLSALMPAAYANTRDLPRHFAPEEEVTQEQADRIYFHNLLLKVSTTNANLQPGQLSIPYLSRYVPDNPDPRFAFGMTSARYRELVRHLLLRGCDGLYLFNLGYPGSTVTPRLSFESLEDVRAVYDELLAHRAFLDRGQVMNYHTPALFSDCPLWSGLRLEDQCLVRTFTLGPQPRTVLLMAFPGVPVMLEAPPEGATYLIQRDARYRRLD